MMAASSRDEEKRQTGFAAGTLVRTPFSEVAIETLQVGDLVVSPSGDRHRVTKTREIAPSSGLPAVRIVAGAFGGGAPQRDLVLLAGQMVMVTCVDEILIPICDFLNEATVARVEAADRAFRQIELEWPDVIVANGLPVASGFAGEVLAAANDSHSLPLCDDPVIIDALRMRLYTHALALAWTPTRGDPELALEIDGHTVHPRQAGEIARFVIEALPEDVWIVSRSFVPCNFAMTTDSRRLGVQIKAVMLDDGLEARTVGFDDPRLTAGFHAVEAGFRWTDGRAKLPRELWQGIGIPFFLTLTYDSLMPGPLAAPAGSVVG